MTQPDSSRSPSTRAQARLGSVSREKVRARARELAVIAGRVPPEVAQCDYEEAKRELTGESDPDRQEAMLEDVPAR